MRPTRLTSAATGAIALLIALLVVVDVGWLQSLDRVITDALHGFALDHPWWVRVMTWWSIVFHPTAWRIAAAVLVAWLLHRGDRFLAWWVAATMITGGILGVLLKLLFGRHRPDLLDPVARAAGYSFPSGHALTNTLGAAVFLTVLLPYAGERPLARRLLWVCAVMIPLVTGLSRVALGVHWTSDVVAGWLLGVAIAAGTRAIFLAYAHRATLHSPAVGPNLRNGHA